MRHTIVGRATYLCARAGCIAGGAILAACTSEASRDSALTTRADSAGITIVTNSSTERQLALEGVRRLTIGDVDGPEAFGQLQSGFLAVDSADRIFAFDGSSHEVRVYDRAGVALSRFGRKGGGPGEFGQPMALQLDGDEALNVIDWRQRGAVRFTAEGEVLPPPCSGRPAASLPQPCS